MEVQIKETQIPGVMILEWPVYRDERGFFQEIYRRDALLEAGIDLDWKQDNLSFSAKNVIRGLHYQVIQPQAKLVQVVRGAVFDVAVDIRRSSPTFGQHVTIELKAGDGRAFLIPAGLAHGFAALEPDTAFLYKVSALYYAAGERTILWNDPDLRIEWPVSQTSTIISEKDRRGVPFKSAEMFP
ncbi:MAG: dTDP-4-dehydrorhamnose 3,5-epimerase [Terracidiphilus sp.]